MALDPKEYSAVVKARGGKLQPDLINSLALKTLTREEAEAEGWSTYYVPQPCAAGHVAARYVKNDLCVSCWLVRQGRGPLYPMAKNRTYRPVTVKATTATASNAPVAPPAPIEPKPVEQRFLAALDESRDFDAAAAAVGWTRGLVESRASSNPTFKAALDDLCERRQIPRTLKATATPAWTEEMKRNLIRHFVNGGLMHSAREAVGVSATDYFDQLDADPKFAAAVEAARPLAMECLKERSLAAASSGNEKLLQFLTKNAEPESDISNMSHEQLNAELESLLKDLDKKGLIHHQYVYRHAKTGAQIDLREYEAVDDSDNADLVS